jgi:hypothetical protein
MSRIKGTEQAALMALNDAEAAVDALFASIGMRLNNPALVEIRRLAVFGQALLFAVGRAVECQARPGDVAAALRRLVTPPFDSDVRQAFSGRQALSRQALSRQAQCSWCGVPMRRCETGDEGCFHCDSCGRVQAPGSRVAV